MPRCAVLVTAIALAACSAIRAASADDPPTEWWQARMNAEFHARPAVRIRGGFGTAELHHASAGPLGIHADDIRLVHARRGEPVFVENDPSTIAWRGIERIDLPTSGTGFGALLGAAVGMAAAVTVAATTHVHSDHGADARPVLLAVGGALVGGALGSHKQRWHAYYPPPDDGLRLHPVSEAR